MPSTHHTSPSRSSQPLRLRMRRRPWQQRHPRLVRTAAVCLLAAVLVVEAGCAPRRQPSVGRRQPTAAMQRWTITDLGRCAGTSSVLFLPDAVVWCGQAREYAAALTRWDAASGVAREIHTFPGLGHGADAALSGGRLYWIHAVDSEDAQPSVLRCHVLSVMPDGSDVETVSTAARIGSLRANADRLVWTQREKRTSAWSIMTMRPSDGRIRRVARVRARSVDIALGERVLAWAVPDSTGIHVTGVEADGDLSPNSRMVAAGTGSYSRYQAGSLAGGDARLAWSARGAPKRWHFYTLAAGETRPERLSTRPTKAISGMVFEGHVRGVEPIAPAVSGERVVWRYWDERTRQVLTRAAADTTPTVLGTYRYPDYVPLPSVSGDRVAWAVDRAATHYEDQTQHGRVMTWKAGEETPTVLFDSGIGNVEGTPSALMVTTNGDRVAWEWWVFESARMKMAQLVSVGTTRAASP